MGSVLVDAFRYNRWANLHLLDACARLSDTQLKLTVPGTYGTIEDTFLHLVGAERRYLWRLGGQRGRLTRRHKFPGVAALRTEAASTGARLIAVATRVKSEGTVVSKWPEGTFRIGRGLILVQALHHGNDHRTHVCTILGAHDIDYGDLDVWAFGHATGAVVPISAKA